MSALPTSSDTEVATSPTRTKEWAKTTSETILETIRTGDPKVPEDNGHQFCASCHRRLKEVQPPKPDEAFFDRYPEDGEPKWTGGGHITLGTLKELVHGEDSELAGSITVTGELDLTDFEDYQYADSPVSARAAIGRAYPTENATYGLVDEGALRAHSSDADDDDDATYWEIDESVPSANPWHQNPRQGLVCKCGVSNHRYIDRPISKETAVEYAGHLSDSIESIRDDIKHEVDVLGENRVPEWRVARIEEWRHSREVLVTVVERLKDRRDMQGIHPIFEAALAVALRRPDEY